MDPSIDRDAPLRRGPLICALLSALNGRMEIYRPEARRSMIAQLIVGADWTRDPSTRADMANTPVLSPERTIACPP